MSTLPRRLAPLLAVAGLLLASTTYSAPERVWVAWLDGRTVDQAIATGAVVLDRFPDAAIVADEASAATLAAAGYRLEPTVALPTGRTISLIRGHTSEGTRPGARSTQALDPARLARLGVEILWRGEANAILSSDGLLPDDAVLLRFHRQTLRTTPLRREIKAEPGPTPEEGKAPSPGATISTEFAPIVQQMVDQVSGSEWMQWIRNLSGAPILVGGNPVTLNTRSTPTIGCDRAEQYVYEQLLAMGYTDVQYDPFSFSGTNARNVVATLPGVETPQRIVVLGGHLDSTSPQSSSLAPGANDNASGAAALLIAAAILRQYSFQSTIQIVAFTGEEQGLHGSTHFANAAAAAGDSIVGAVIMDMIGWKNVFNQIDIEGETAWLPLMTVMNDAVESYTNIDAQMMFFSFGSDHVPFQDVGYPAFLAIETEYGDYPCYHATCDTSGWNQPVFGAETVRAVLATVAHVAGARDFFIAHTPLTGSEDTTGPYDVVATIHQLAALEPDSLLLHWWANGGPEQVVKLTPTGNPNQFHGLIPGQPAGTTIDYWIGALDVDGRHAFHPLDAPSSTHQFVVSPRTTIYSEGFESGAAGWISGGTGNDWQIATAAGLADDPATAYAGTKVAGTDVTGLGANLGKYENNANSWLESPPIDCSEASTVRLSFQRKLMIERSNGGTYDVARVFVNGTEVWESPSAANLIDPAWNLQDLDISALADGNPAVRVRYTLKSDGSLIFGGWNIDEFKITGLVATPLAADPGTSPLRAVLLPNIPNPGAPTTLRFALPARAAVDLSIYDVRGRRVKTMVHETREAGHHEVRWDGRGADGTTLPAGVYFSRLTTGGVVETRKLILMR